VQDTVTEDSIFGIIAAIAIGGDYERLLRIPNYP
jgi:hypothetical protein